MTKNQFRYRMSKLYRFLDQDHKIKFQRMRLYRGHITTITYPTTVYIDHRDELIPTLIHEFLHYIHPQWSETRILQAEAQFVRQLTDRQIRNILKKFASRL